MDAATLTQKIQDMKLDEDEKTLILDALKERGDDAVVEVITLLELKAKNAELAGITLQQAGSDLAEDLQDAVSKTA